MIKLLEPSDVKKHWKLIKYTLVGQLNPVTDADEDQIKKALLDQILVCFAILEPDKKEPLRGFILCAISRDLFTNRQSLLIIGAFAVLEVSIESWSDAIITLMGFAKRNQCYQISCYTQSGGMVELARKFGMVSNYNFMTLQLEE